MSYSPPYSHVVSHVSPFGTYDYNIKFSIRIQHENIHSCSWLFTVECIPAVSLQRVYLVGQSVRNWEESRKEMYSFFLVQGKGTITCSLWLVHLSMKIGMHFCTLEVPQFLKSFLNNSLTTKAPPQFWVGSLLSVPLGVFGLLSASKLGGLIIAWLTSFLYFLFILLLLLRA